MNRFTLRQLQVFLATADVQNISKAAKSLAMSQSAASNALSELEQQYQMQLFDRVGKRLQLNALGYAVRPQAQALLEQAQQLDLTLAQQQAGGRIKVGATLTIGNYLAVTIMSHYLTQNPNRKVELDVANTSQVVRKVKNFELDIGLIEGDFLDAELEVIPWLEDELQVFCAPDHDLAHCPALDDQQLKNSHWILREPGSGTRQTFDRDMHDLLSELSVLLELQHTEAIKRAVEAGLGIGCLSKRTLVDAFKRGSLIPLQTPGRSFSRRFYFILHRHKYRSEALLEWIKLCQQLNFASN